MARTLMVVTQAPQPFATAGVVLPLTTAAALVDGPNGMYFPSTGREVLFLFNAHATLTGSVAVASQNDAERRKGDIPATNVAAAGGYLVTQMFPVFGWSIGGYINVDFAGTVSALYYALYQVTLSAWPVI